MDGRAVAAEGVFERDTAPVEGPGAVVVGGGVVRVRASAVRSGLVTALSGVLALIAMVAVAVGGMILLDGDSLRTVAKAGVAVTLGTYLGASALLRRLLPLRRVELVIAPRYLVSASVEAGALQLLVTEPSCSGRLRFRTRDPEGLVAAVAAMKPPG